MGPLSVTRLMPPLGLSKLIGSELCDHSIVGGGSGAYCTKQVRLMVDPWLMYRSEPPSISVIGSGSDRDGYETKAKLIYNSIHNPKSFREVGDKWKAYAKDQAAITMCAFGYIFMEYVSQSLWTSQY